MCLDSCFPFLGLFSPPYPPPTVLHQGRVVPGCGNNDCRPYFYRPPVFIDRRPSYRCHSRPLGRPVSFSPPVASPFFSRPLHGRVRVGR